MVVDHMKIALLSPYLFHGGAEKQFRKLADTLVVRKDVELKIYTLGSVNRDNTWVKKLERLNVDIISYDCDPQLSSKLSIIKCLLRISYSIFKYRPKYLYFYTLYFLPLVMIFPIICHNAIFSERILSPQTLKRKWMYKFINLFIYKLVVNGNSLFDFFLKINKDTVLIKNYVEAIPFKSDGRYKGVAVIARISEEKNILFLIENMNDKYFPINLYFSAQDDIYRYLLEQEIMKLGKKVNFIGNRNLSDIYKENRYIVHPSLSEGTPNVLIEAMASKFPCFCSDIRENIDTGINTNFIFSINDGGESLNQKLESWNEMNDVEKTKILSENRITSNEFSIDVFQCNINKLFS